jgi:hypothetical protein
VAAGQRWTKRIPVDNSHPNSAHKTMPTSSRGYAPHECGRFQNTRHALDDSTRSAILIASAKARLQRERPDAQAPGAMTSDHDVITQQERQLLGQITGWRGDWYTDWPHHEGASFGAWIWFLLKNRLGGWWITILVVSLGAPFWFDTLSRFMNVRNSGKPPEQSNYAKAGS